MAYTKQTWGNSASTPLSASRLNKLETQAEETIAEVLAQVGDSTKPIGQALNTTIAAEAATPGGAAGGIVSPALPYNGAASILDPRFRPEGVSAVSVANGTTDCSPIIEAIWAAGFSTVMLPSGSFGLAATTYRVTRTIDLATTRSIIGGGRGQRGAGTGGVTVLWDGAAGGKVISSFVIDTTDRYKTYSGSLINFRVRYPSAKLAAGSIGIYLGRPSFGDIRDVEVRGDTDNNTITPPANSYAWWLDGCENPGTIALINVHAAHHFSEGFRISASHVSIVGTGCAYVGWGYHITQDSINSPSGPPYNILLMEPHSYYSTSGHIRISQAKSATIISGFNEPETSASTMIQCESTFTGGHVSVISPYKTAGATLTHYGTGTVLLDNPQDRTRGIYVGNSTTGVPSSVDGLPSRRIRFNNQFQTRTTTNTTQNSITGSSQGIAPGLSGILRYIVRGRVKASTATTGYRIGVIQTGNTYGAGTAAPGTPLWGYLDRAAPPGGADTWEYFQFGYEYSGQNGFFYYTPVWQVVGSGTLTLDSITLEVEAI